MNQDINRQLVVELSQRMGRFDFEGAGELRHDDFVCEWPQSNERICRREKFVALNANYPGRSPSASPARCAGYDGTAEIKRAIVAGDQVAAEVILTWENRTVLVCWEEVR